MDEKARVPIHHAPYGESLTNFANSVSRGFSFQRKRPAPPRKATYSAPLPVKFRKLQPPQHGQSQMRSGNRYFSKIRDESKDSASTSGETTSKSLKRKVFPTAAPDFISLDASEPPRKHTKIDRDKSSQNDENNNATTETAEPYSVREIRRLFISDPFSEQIHQFYVKNCQREAFLKKKQQLRSALENAINRTSEKNCKLLLVGSSINGFGRITSDADFCLVIDKFQENIKNRRRVMRTLYEVQQLLRKAPFARSLQVIPAKVPILKFMDSYSGMECDVNVNNLTGVRNTELMKRYAMLDPRVQPLALIIKEWAHQRNINDASQGTMNSYSLVLMVVHFLQCGVYPPVLPSLQVEYPDLFRSNVPILDVSNLSERVKPHRSTNKMTLSQLLKKFFKYFAEVFNFEDHVMSVRLGKVMHIDEILSTEKEWTRSIKIEEPFDRTNTARAVYCDVNAEKIFVEFRKSNRILQRGNGLEYLLEGVPSRRRDSSVIVIDDL